MPISRQAATASDSTRALKAGSVQAFATRREPPAGPICSAHSVNLRWSSAVNRPFSIASLDRQLADRDLENFEVTDFLDHRRGGVDVVAMIVAMVVFVC